MTYLGWDLPAFASSHPGITTIQDSILDACYESGLAAAEEEEVEEDEPEDNRDEAEEQAGSRPGREVAPRRSEEGNPGDEGDNERQPISFAFNPDTDGAAKDVPLEGAHHEDVAVKKIPSRASKQQQDQLKRSSLKSVGCGRTDVGVSGLHQVVTLRLKRAIYVDEVGEDDDQPDDRDRDEKDHYHHRIFSYADALNHFLPPEVRILSWSVVSDDFSARFNCTERSYTYHFPKG